MNTLHIALAFVLLVLLVLLVICVSTFALLVRLCSAPWRRMARRRVEQEAEERDRIRLLNAVVQHKYRRGDAA